MTAQQIQKHWDQILDYIETYIQEPRKSKLLEFYKQYESRLILMPASHKTAYHNCFPGGYISHVNFVIAASLHLYEKWIDLGATQNFTIEELVFSALNHDLGKMGTKDEEFYLPNPSKWHVDNKGELYECNNKISYMSVPDRSLFLLTQHGISYNENEMLSIKLHDGMYDEANHSYLSTYLPETKPRTSLIYIIHQADQMATRIEFEKFWFPKFYPSIHQIPKKKIVSKYSETLKELVK